MSEDRYLVDQVRKAMGDTLLGGALLGGRKRKAKKGLSAWNKTVKATAKAHPSMSFVQVVKAAKKKYSGGAKRKRSSSKRSRSKSRRRK